MSAVELDPQFIKALRLLRSKSKDSGAQLKAMLDEAIRQRRGGGVRSPHSGRAGSSERPTLDRERDKKKDLDRLKKDLSELTERPPEAKRSRLESPALSSSSHTPSPTPPPSSREGDLEQSDVGEDEDMDLTEEMNLEDQFDCSCCVCKTFTQESGNKLMECSSCQNLYHQDCHNPPVSNEKASDPRLIWNCDKCLHKGKNTGSKLTSLSAGIKDERKVEKEKPKSSSSSSLVRSGSSSSSSSKHKPSPAKSESRGGVNPSSLASLTSSKMKPALLSASTLSAGVAPGELSSTAKKRMKLIKQQAADMSLSSIGKKKLTK